MENPFKQSEKVAENGEKKSLNSMEKRERMDKLKERDNRYEDSIYDLAKAEDEFRKDLAVEGISGKAADKLADKFSDETLGKIEANKERWMDLLTGLRNKNAYKEEIPQLLSMEKRKDRDCSFLMIDLDHFKNVNDSFGHLVGDKVLKKMANLIKDQVRASDIVYRFGGEEFIVFLSDTASLMAQELAERIRTAVKNYSLDIINEKGENIKLNKTLSIGVVGTDQLKDWNKYSEKDATEFLDKMTKFADIAVYAAKTGGRDRVTPYSENLEKIKQGS
jgi:diguanylate cyclase (GGDEF)-like protein